MTIFKQNYRIIIPIPTRAVTVRALTALVGALSVAMLISVPAMATEYQWIEPANTQVFVIEDPLVDLALQIEAMDRARSSVDILAYIQSMDSKVGLPTLNAFLKAQARVKARFLTDGVGKLLGGLDNHALKYLQSPRLAESTETITLSPLAKLRSGLRLTDMMHKKVMIIDRGTPNEKIWVSGRNRSIHSASDLDFSIVLRPIDPSKPYIGDQIFSDFESTWLAGEKISRKFKGGGSKKALEIPSAGPVRFDFESQVQVYLEMSGLLSVPVHREEAALRANEFRPTRMRVLSNDLLGHLLTRIWGRTRKSRKNFESDIDNNLAKQFAGSKRILIGSMMVSMGDRLLEAIKASLANGGTLDLYTNGPDAHVHQAASEIGYLMGLGQMKELIEASDQASVWLFNLIKAEYERELVSSARYAHTKVNVADSVVTIGTHNNNDQSRIFADELVVQSDDVRFAAYIHEYYRQRRGVFDKLTCEKALRDLERFGAFEKVAGQIMWPLY